jgi:integrase/recombinase XerD
MSRTDLQPNGLHPADLKSTEIYARSDLDMKRRALDKASAQSPTPAIPFWQKD